MTITTSKKKLSCRENEQERKPHGLPSYLRDDRISQGDSQGGKTMHQTLPTPTMALSKSSSERMPSVA
jgi:hypothetical protein